MNSKKNLQLIYKLIDTLSQKDKEQVLKKILSEKELPFSIFRTKNLSGLEAITIYLKDIKKQTIKEITKTLNRKKSTIYTTYHNAKKKLKGKLDCSDYSITLPIEIFSNRKFAVLESLVFYLKDNKKIPLIKISSLLNKNYSTIKTAYRRYTQKIK